MPSALPDGASGSRGGTRMPKCEGTTGCHRVGAGGLAGGAVVSARHPLGRRRLLLWHLALRVSSRLRCRGLGHADAEVRRHNGLPLGRDGPPAPARSPTACPAGRRCRRRWPPGGGLRRPDSRKPARPPPPQQRAAPRRRPAPRQGRPAPRRLRDRHTPAHRPPWPPPRSARGGAPFPATPVGAASSTLRGCPACPAGRGRRRSLPAPRKRAKWRPASREAPRPPRRSALRRRYGPARAIRVHPQGRSEGRRAAWPRRAIRRRPRRQ